MQRLVYAPRVQAWIKSDEGVVDVSDYITTCDVRRKVNQVSQADLTLRNPKMIFTEHKRADGSIGPMFHPMDPIIIAMTRLRGKPIQVFTGYCDKTPYLQLFPGVCRLETSCTLKRLQYTFWDPGLPFVIDFLQQYGWVPKGKGTIVSPEGASKSLDQTKMFNDGSIANLLFAVLKNIGGWDEKNIFIENLPDGIIPIVMSLFEQGVPDNTKATQNLETFLKNIIGTAALGSSPVAGGNGGGQPIGPDVRKGKFLGRFEATAYGPPWGGQEGGGTTASGKKLPDHPTPGHPIYYVATGRWTKPGEFGKKLFIWPNPYNYKGAWSAEDTGGAIGFNDIDFLVMDGREKQGAWGRRNVNVWFAEDAGATAKDPKDSPGNNRSPAHP